jgi:hypothetical protein
MWQSVPWADMTLVVDMPGAIERLQNVAWVRLDDKELLRLTGQPPHPGAAQPYLLRSVGYSPTGGYNVTFFGTEVLVDNGTNGSQEQMYRSAIVVYFPFEPTKLYVHCFADE